MSATTTPVFTEKTIETITGPTMDAVITQFGAVDYGVIAVLLLVSAAIGIYFGFFDGTEQTTEEYLLGGRRMRPIPVAISLVASQLSAYSIISVPSEIYSFGSQYTICVVPAVIAVTLTINYGILPVFYNNNVDNCYGYLEMRFGKTTKNFTTFMFIFAVMLMLPIGSFLPAFAFAQISGLNLHLINAVVTVVCIIYTMLGGGRTYVMQAFVMVFSIIVVPALAIVRIGGIGETWERVIDGGRVAAPTLTIDFETRQTLWNMVSGMYLMWMAHVAFSQSCVQRLSSLPSLKHARLTLYIFMVGVILVKVAVGVLGAVMYAYYKGCDPVKAGILAKADQLVPYFVNEIVGHLAGMPGLFISCVFSASLSTVSAYLNCISGLVYKDYVCRVRAYRHTERRANVIMKTTIVTAGLYCIAMGFLVERSASLYQLQQIVAGLLTGTVVGTFTLGLFYPWASQKATLYGAVGSMVLMAWWIMGSIMNPTIYTPLPTSIDNCNATAAASIEQLWQSTTEIPHTTTTAVPQSIDAPFSIYTISFQWYSLFGTLFVWLISVPLCHTIFPLDAPVEAHLVSPLLQWLVPGALAHSNARHVEMQLIGGDGKTKPLSGVVTESKYVVRQ